MSATVQGPGCQCRIVFSFAQCYDPKPGSSRWLLNDCELRSDRDKELARPCRLALANALDREMNARWDQGQVAPHCCTRECCERQLNHAKNARHRAYVALNKPRESQTRGEHSDLQRKLNEAEQEVAAGHRKHVQCAIRRCGG